jgi:hypothetical protein
MRGGGWWVCHEARRQGGGRHAFADAGGFLEFGRAGNIGGEVMSWGVFGMDVWVVVSRVFWPVFACVYCRRVVGNYLGRFMGVFR